MWGGRACVPVHIWGPWISPSRLKPSGVSSGLFCFLTHWCDFHPCVTNGPGWLLAPKSSLYISERLSKKDKEGAESSSHLKTGLESHMSFQPSSNGPWLVCCNPIGQGLCMLSSNWPCSAMVWDSEALGNVLFILVVVYLDEACCACRNGRIQGSQRSLLFTSYWTLALHFCVLSLCPLVAQKIVATRKKQQLSIGPCKSLPSSPSHSSVCSAQVSAVHISQVGKVVREVRQPASAKEDLGQEVFTASAKTVTTPPNFVNNSMFYWLPSSFRSCSGQVGFMRVNL